MTIKEVEKKLNISRANIRFYEKEGLLEPKRNDNEYRDFSEEDLKRLEQILLFRKCNVSIENIRLIFNGTKSIDEVFKSQISVIENEVKELEGAKTICKKLSQEKLSVDKLDTEKYLGLMKTEEERGNKFYDVAEDYIMATEKLYQSIIEKSEFKVGEKMKKGVKVGLYVASAFLLFIFLILGDYLFTKNIDWEGAIVLTFLFTVVDVVGVKKYIEKKTNEKFTKKQSIKHFLITLLIMIIALFGYYSIKEFYVVNKEVNSNVLEMSVKNSLINIANDEFKSDGNASYAESHKILDLKVQGEKIYVYVVADYGLFSKSDNDLKVVDDKKVALTMIFKKDKNSSGIYELQEYDGTLPDYLKNKTDVNYEDDYFQSQLKSYFN